MSSHYVKRCQEIVADYRTAGGAWPAKKVEIAEWALSNRRWVATRDDMRRMCGDTIAEAMREEVFTDEAGRTIRSKLPATTTRGGEQGTFWDDLRTAPVEHVQVSVAQQRNGIVADCYKLSNIVRYFNEHHETSDQIELVLEFTKDVRERDQSKTAISPSASAPPKRSAPPRPAVPPLVAPPGPSRPSSRPSVHV